MSTLAIALMTLVAVEMFLRLPTAQLLGELLQLYKKISRVTLSRSISDHWKQKALMRYAGGIALTTLKVAVGIFAVGATVLLLSTIFDNLFDSEIPTLEVFASETGMSISLALSILYLFCRSRFAK